MAKAEYMPGINSIKHWVIMKILRMPVCYHQNYLQETVNEYLLYTITEGFALVLVTNKNNYLSMFSILRIISQITITLNIYASFRCMWETL